MASLRIGIDCLNGDSEVDAALSITGDSNGHTLDDTGEYVEYPVLRFDVLNSDTQERFSFSVRSIRDIDTIRRYCEMTLEHQKAGII